MSARPRHLGRRNGIYFARFRLPCDLAARLRMVELRRSLATPNYAVARYRCLSASLWFARAVEDIRAMPTANRDTLVEAANEYFKRLIGEVDQPRPFPPDGFDQELNFQIERSRAAVAKLDGALATNTFGAEAVSAADHMASCAGLRFDELPGNLQLIAKRYAAQALRQQMRYFLHQLQSPHTPFSSDDTLLQSPTEAALPIAQAAELIAPAALKPELTLQRAVDQFVAYKNKVGWGSSARDEHRRVLKWLMEEITPTRPVSSITVDELRDFRDKIQRLRAGGQGKKLSLMARVQTDDEQALLKFATRERYWRHLRAFFAYLASDWSIPNLSVQLLFQGGKGEIAASPKPFSTDEVRKLLSTPLFQGYKSTKRLKEPGNVHRRGSHWWAAVLLLHTGMRAGDVAQLMPEDFIFEHDIPHLIIRPGKLPEGMSKTSKFGARVHHIPLLPILLELGLRQFVAARARGTQHRRLFYDLYLGANRRSDVLTKFFARYLSAFGLHSRGRATHVFRHTVVYRLRSIGEINENIAYVVGHRLGTQTSEYGVDELLERQLKTLSALDYGFDMLKILGGPYDPKVH